MPPRQGNLRVRKGQRLFGPMTKADLEKLCSAGRIDGHDQVSVGGGPWLTVTSFLAPATSAEPRPQPPASAMPAAGLDQDILLELDPAPPIESAPAEKARPPVALDDDDDDYDILEPPPAKSPIQPAARPTPLPKTFRQSPVQPPPDPEPAAVYGLPMPGASPIAPGAVPARRAPGEWFAHIRGGMSSQLTKENLLSLVLIGELHAGSQVRHFTWLEHQWAPISAIPELADVAAAAMRGSSPPPGSFL